MQHILLPSKRTTIVKDRAFLSELCKRLKCEIKLTDENTVTISGEAYDEFNAKNVLAAFGRGFDIDTAYKLLEENYFFSSINLKEIYKNEDRVRKIKGRLIGKEGKTKEYIESVSGAKMCVFGNTVSFIGTTEELKIADAAIQVLLDGGTHKKAYHIMEIAKRKSTI